MAGEYLKGCQGLPQSQALPGKPDICLLLVCANTHTHRLRRTQSNSQHLSRLSHNKSQTLFKNLVTAVSDLNVRSVWLGRRRRGKSWLATSISSHVTLGATRRGSTGTHWRQATKSKKQLRVLQTKGPGEEIPSNRELSCSCKHSGLLLYEMYL